MELPLETVQHKTNSSGKEVGKLSRCPFLEGPSNKGYLGTLRAPIGIFIFAF